MDLYNASIKNKAGRAFIVIDSNKKVYSTLYIIYDHSSAHLLSIGTDNEYQNTGASSLLIWEAIKFCSQVTKSFDFNGSNIQSIERFYRNFGAKKNIFSIAKV